MAHYPPPKWRPNVCSRLLAGLLSALLLVLHFASPNSGFAESTESNRYEVVIFTAGTESAAEIIAHALPAAFRDQVGFRQETENGVAAVVGGFSNMADAMLVAETIKATTGHTASAERSEATVSEAVDPLDLIPSRFDLEVPLSSQLEYQNTAGVPGYSQLQVLDTPESRDEYRMALLQARESVSTDNVLAGYVETNLGILMLLDGDLTEAKAIFERVADGEVKAAANHRIMSMWRLGWIAHQQGDHLEAYRLHTKTQRFAADNPRTVARAIKERTGLVMEIAKDLGHGELADVRAFVDANRHLVDPAYWDDLSVIDLMYLETFYYEGDRDELLNRVDAYLEAQDPRAKRQIATALCFKGLALFGKDRFADAFATYEKVLEMEFGPNDRWQTIPDFKVHALRWLAHLSYRLEDPALEEYYRAKLAAYEQSKSTITEVAP
jgi:tetratricopeptide (TPR) repeat protein